MSGRKPYWNGHRFYLWALFLVLLRLPLIVVWQQLQIWGLQIQGWRLRRWRDALLKERRDLE